MLFNPEEIAKKNIISGSYKLQTNAIDFTLDSLFNIDNQISYISNDKTHVEHQKQYAAPLLDADTIRKNYLLPIYREVTDDTARVSGWLLQPNTSYDGTSNVYVEVPEGMAAFLIVRSTLNRNALRLTSGLYDSGFKGHIGFVLHNGVGETFIEQGTYVGQICFIESNNAELYTGGYNTEKGQHWTEATKPKSTIKTKEPVSMPTTTFKSELEVPDVVIIEELPVIISAPIEAPELTHDVDIAESKTTSASSRRRR